MEAEFVNLYSKSRGANRFPALVETLQWLQKRPEVAARGLNVEVPQSLVEWIKGETKLGNPALAAKVLAACAPDGAAIVTLDDLQWGEDSAAFVEFDKWLFEPSKPRGVDEARAKAEQLVPAADLRESLLDPSVKARLDRNIQAYVDSDAQYIPVLISPGFDTVVGRPESDEALLQMLKEELFGAPHRSGK